MRMGHRGGFALTVYAALFAPLEARAQSAASETRSPVAESTATSETTRSTTRGDTTSTADEVDEERAIVLAYNTGFQWHVAPGIAFPSGGGAAALYLNASFGYGFEAGAVVLTPALRITGYFTDPAAYLGMATGRVTLPVGRFAPFVEVGAGPGLVSATSGAGGDPSQVGVAWAAGGGAMFHFNARFGLGAQAGYQAITNTSFKAITFGPMIAFAL